MSRPARINLSVAARLMGCDLSSVSRYAAAGKLGPRKRGAGNKRDVLIEVEAVERHLGRKLSDAEIVAAQGSTPNWSELRITVDPGVVAHFIESRDDEWRLHLERLGIELEQSPAMPTIAAPLVDQQWFFTRSQVEALLASALAQRDAQWRAFNLNDHVYKAQRPNGPAALDLSNVSMTEEN